ncbi:MAG: 5-oxoprolinase/urea amidolyase family protein [Pseudomonadota bacterium]|nr:5-oxoprolinase/urea amidolyase family protein [Pseudomonadota bacterium]
MFDKVLIANRGEIAGRILRTLERLDVRSVAVYSDADKYSPHVTRADEAVCIGPGASVHSYLNQERLLAAARASGAGAIHPGYGFLSENAEFAEACAAAGIVFVGPTPAQMRSFGLKHMARELAAANGVALLPGSDLLADLAAARREAARIGYPVMLKSTAGGGGIGMQLVRGDAQLDAAFAAVERLATKNFSRGGIFLEKYIERARHIEVQIFGDGAGTVVALGERDCSTQRRHQKIIEETPAPGLPDATRARLHESAVRLARSVNYQSAGTVEYVYDVSSGEFYFLEVNTRLQVEHGVTEEVLGIDLVEWMLRQAAGESVDLRVPAPRGAAIQARLYAEDPARQFRPSSGLVTRASFPEDVRIETWIADGTEVTPLYDPLLAKIITVGEDRADALRKLRGALADTVVSGIETNLEYLRCLIADPLFADGQMTTRALEAFAFTPRRIEVVAGGTQTTIQDHPGRIGYWNVGVPPSGPMDDVSFRLVNRAVGNRPAAAALEITVSGPTLKFDAHALICLGGAAMAATLEGEPMPFWVPVEVRAGQVLRIGNVTAAGCRAYLAVRGGFDVPEYLGSRATFTLGKFGGHGGRALAAGDTLHLGPVEAAGGEGPGEPCAIPAQCLPKFTHDWELGVLYGPHGAPDYFTEADIEAFFSQSWEVHYNSNRTGVRLIGPKPTWARADGGEAGLHPSNIHDNAYAVGTVDFTGDMPVILGPDGPSLGGFVCPATVVKAELWKLGQLRPNDRIRFKRLTPDDALASDRAQELMFEGLRKTTAAPAAMASRAAMAEFASPHGATAAGPAPAHGVSAASAPAPAQGAAVADPAPAHRAAAAPTSGPARNGPDAPILAGRPARAAAPAVVYRRAGDKYMLIEYGPPVLDLELRLRVHALTSWLEAARLPGIIELTPGIRSLQVHYESRVLPLGRLLDVLAQAEESLVAIEDMSIATRIVRLPLSWDDDATQVAIAKYMQSVRADAPWCPSNIEFIRRVNGLDSIDDVKRTVFDASYLVLGLGDVYLGAPVTTPIDPRHRLVTTKYNPARTWTPENAVGIGGAYLCVYGMEGPGGYQFVGRTCQMWNTYHVTKEFQPTKPWLLRFFDQIRFYPVSGAELLQFRDDFLHGRVQLGISEETFRLKDYRRFLEHNAVDIAAHKARQQAAFDAERQRWEASGQIGYAADLPAPQDDTEAEELQPGHVAVASPVSGNVWKITAVCGQAVKAGDSLVMVESMKMELPVTAPADGVVIQVRCAEGRAVSVGQTLVVLGG